MKTLKAILVCALVITVFSGCAARSLSVLQTEFNAAVKAKKACASQAENVKPGETPCSVDFDTLFADIAAQTEESLHDYKGGEKVKIGLHRLHAYALWQSGAAEQAIVDAARKGLAECAGDKFKKVPRDCALLTTIGSFKAIEAAGARIAAIKQELASAGDKEALCAKHASAWRDEVVAIWRNYYRPLAKDMKEIAAKESVSEGVLVYLQNQQDITFDQVLDLKNIARECVSARADLKRITQCPCTSENRTSGHREICAEVYDKAKPGFAFYHEAFCVSEDVFNSNDCPCGYETMGNLTDQQKIACQYVQTNPEAQNLHESKCLIKRALQ